MRNRIHSALVQHNFSPLAFKKLTKTITDTVSLTVKRGSVGHAGIPLYLSILGTHLLKSCFSSNLKTSVFLDHDTVLPFDFKTQVDRVAHDVKQSLVLCDSLEKENGWSDRMNINSFLQSEVQLPIRYALSMLILAILTFSLCKGNIGFEIVIEQTNGSSCRVSEESVSL